MKRENINPSFVKSGAMPTSQHIYKPESAWTWRYAGVAVGFGGGFLSMFLGIFLNVLAWLVRRDAPIALLNQIGTWLVISTIPLMMLGAHCLDKIEMAAKAERIEYCNRRGLSEKEREQINSPER